MEQRSDELFHILDDDSDAIEYSTEVLNQYFLRDISATSSMKKKKKALMKIASVIIATAK